MVVNFFLEEAFSAHCRAELSASFSETIASLVEPNHVKCLAWGFGLSRVATARVTRINVVEWIGFPR